MREACEQSSSVRITNVSQHDRLGAYFFNEQRALLNEYRVSVCV